MIASWFAIHDDPVIMEWTRHYLRCEPLAPRLLGCSIAAIYILGYLMFGSALTAIIPCAGFIFILSEFFFPVHYTVRQNTISAVCAANATEVTWSSVGSVRNVKHGIRLDMTARNSPDVFNVRNITIYCDNDVRRRLVVFALERRLQIIT